MTKEQIENIVWRACDTFRGTIDPSEYKNYILTMLFLKYLSDLAKETRENLLHFGAGRHGGNLVPISLKET
jgi:type I restriction enzyme M protein